MSDNTLTENDDDDFEIIEGTPPEEAPKDDADKDEKVDDAEGDDSDEQDDDERLAESEDDHEDEITSQNRKRRVKRREIQKKARENAQRELEMLRNQNAELARRVAAIEGHAVQTNVSTLEQRLAQAVREVEQAEHIIAKATEAGNGEDVVAAMRIRDQAIAQAQQLNNAKQHFEQARSAPPQANPAVVNFAKQWMDANPWYDPRGVDRDSALTKSIDAELAREGYNPASRDYWEELTNRVSDALGEGNEGASTQAAKPKRKAPPTGNTREHAPVSTKKEIYVTPERKAAMIEAGIWDDPVARNRMLKAYQAYDKNGSAS